MAGNRIGGKKAAQTNIKRYGEDYYRNIGAKGGSTPKIRPGGFAIDDRNIIEKLLHRPSRAARMGKIGGAMNKQPERASINVGN